MNLEKYSAVGFDLYGTLLSSPGTSYFDPIINFLKKKEQEGDHTYQNSVKIFYRDIMLFNYSIRDFCKFQGFRIPDKVLLDVEMKLERAFHRIQKIPQTTQLLEKVSQSVDSIFLISNVSDDFIDPFYDQGLDQYFEERYRIFSSDQGLKKPDERIFRRALERLGISEEETLFVGDHPHNDIYKPRKIGIDAMHIDDFKKQILWDLTSTS